MKMLEMGFWKTISNFNFSPLWPSMAFQCLYGIVWHCILCMQQLWLLISCCWVMPGFINHLLLHPLRISHSAGVFTALPVFFGWFCYQWYYVARIHKASNPLRFKGIGKNMKNMQERFSKTFCYVFFFLMWTHVQKKHRHMRNPEALCWFWFLLGVAMTVFGAVYECFCYKPVKADPPSYCWQIHQTININQRIRHHSEWNQNPKTWMIEHVWWIPDPFCRGISWSLSLLSLFAFCEAREWDEEDGSGPMAAPTPYIMIQWGRFAEFC